MAVETGALQHPLYIGTAGWSIPRASAERFDSGGTHLQRYARAFACAEINSSFHRPHAGKTYAKWRDSTPPDFRFAVKVPRTITHDLKLRRARLPFEQFLSESAGLGDKRGPLLVQLPPSLAFDRRVAGRFFDVVRAAYAGLLVCEPRHPSWFERPASSLLEQFLVSRVAADPPPVAGAETPGGWTGLAYFRLHGSPRKYWSRYEPAYVETLAATLLLHARQAPVWCVFDNTASGAALENAWELLTLVGR
jgi:uncharacterized protein YecE (DUF72 family)